MESRPLVGRIPDQDILASAPREHHNRVTATRAADGSWGMIYTPGGMPFTVRLERLSGVRLASHWFNPRDGLVISEGEFLRDGERRFVPPLAGVERDWVLVLDDVARGFAAPGDAYSEE
jgi:hypothetical protein